MRSGLVLVLVLLACGAALAKPMEFESVGTGGNCHSCEWVRGEGEITAETPAVFEAFIADLKRRNGGHIGGELRLDSPGGSLAAGMKLGELIRKNEFSTAVGKSPPDGNGRHEEAPGTCESACAFAFLGGVHRRAQAGEVGVHQFYNALGLKDPTAKIFTSVDLSAHQLVSAVLIEYVFRMGVDPRFLSTASSTDPSSMRFLDARELDDFRVVWDPSKFQPWTIEPSGQGIVASSKSRDGNQSVVVFCRRDRVPRLLLVGGASWQEQKDMVTAIEMTEGIKAFDNFFPRNAISIRMIGGKPRFEIEMKGLDLRRMAAAGDALIDASEYAPRAVQMAFFYLPPREGAARNISAALRNCI